MKLEYFLTGILLLSIMIIISIIIGIIAIII